MTGGKKHVVITCVHILFQDVYGSAYLLISDKHSSILSLASGVARRLVSSAVCTYAHVTRLQSRRGYGRFIILEDLIDAATSLLDF